MQPKLSRLGRLRRLPGAVRLVLVIATAIALLLFSSTVVSREREPPTSDGGGIVKAAIFMIGQRKRHVERPPANGDPSVVIHGQHPALFNATHGIEGPHIWLQRNVYPERRRLLDRVLVASLGGVGSSAIIEALRKPLRRLRYITNDLNNRDGIKHAPYDLLSRGALAAFDPTFVLYVLGNPAAAIASHYRRGWPGVQFCQVWGRHSACDSVNLSQLSLRVLTR